MPREDAVSLQPILLGLLAPQPKHGYELYQEFSQELGWIWQMGMSQLYAQLRQLEEAGLVEAHMEPQAHRPARKVYRLTDRGHASFRDWVRQPTPYLRHIRVEFLARLYFFRRLALEGLDELVGRQQAVCQAQVERFERLAAETGDEFRRCVLEFRRGQLEAVICWLDRCLETL
jgi:PadR family transcriptional regulator, regulatory protein AphA